MNNTPKTKNRKRQKADCLKVLLLLNLFGVVLCREDAGPRPARAYFARLNRATGGLNVATTFWF